MEQFDNISNTFSWNKLIEVPILRTFYGADFFIARKIIQTGFVSLCSYQN